MKGKGERKEYNNKYKIDAIEWEAIYSGKKRNKKQKCCSRNIGKIQKRVRTWSIWQLCEALHKRSLKYSEQNPLCRMKKDPS